MAVFRAHGIAHACTIEVFVHEQHRVHQYKHYHNNHGRMMGDQVEGVWINVVLTIHTRDKTIFHIF